MQFALVVIGPKGGARDAVATFINRLETMPQIHVTAQDALDTQAMSLTCTGADDGLPDRHRLRALAAACGVDVYLSAGAPRKRRLLLADMEATIILDEMLDRLAEERGIEGQIKGITARAMAGELDFAQSLEVRTRLFAGVPQSLLEDLATRMNFTPGARTLVATMRASGALTVLVTGGYSIFADRVAQVCGFDRVVTNHPLMSGGVMTGALRAPVGTAETKRDVLLACCAELGISPDMACCIGDGANDALMLGSCGLPISYQGKPVVQDLVDLNITCGDLSAALYAQGFTRSQIVRA